MPSAPDDTTVTKTLDDESLVSWVVGNTRDFAPVPQALRGETMTRDLDEVIRRGLLVDLLVALVKGGAK